MVSSVRAKIIKTIRQTKMEIRNAIEEWFEPESNLPEHKSGDEKGETPKASGSDSSVKSGEVKTELVRARGPKGKFLADDPSTPENEAWVEKPVKAKTTTRKPAAKKPAAKTRGRNDKKV